MAKAWIFTAEYWDMETGENIPEPEVKHKNQYTKKLLNTKIKYNGKYNIQHRTYGVRRCGEQQKLW